MSLQPSQVTSNANSKMCQIELIVESRHLPTPKRMRMIADLVRDFEHEVKGSTHDPFRRD